MMALLRIWPTEPLRFLTDKGLFFYKYDALRKACTQLYYRTMTVYQEYQDRKDISGDFEVEGKIFLGYEYPAHHPIQTETEKQVWATLTCGGFNTLYDEGCAWPLRFSRERPSEQSINEKLENWLGMEIENDNWNEGLDREWSKDLHLIQPFHNLYDHCYFSLYDLIYVREFNLEVHVDRQIKEDSCFRNPPFVFFMQEKVKILPLRK